MPRIVNDVMVELSSTDKKIIRRIGYKECGKILKKSEHYLRGLASKGERYMRKKDLDKIRRAEEWGV